MRLRLVRHTRPDVEAGVLYGQTDVGVRESFSDEARKVREKLGADPGGVVSSPLARCRLLAEALAGEPVQTDARLMEMNFGEWENRRWEEIDRRPFDEWAEDFVNTRCPGGESFDDLYKRTVAALDDLRGRDTDTVVVTHGGVVRALLAHVTRMPLDAVLSVEVDFGSITTLVLDGESARVVCVNC